MAKAMTKIGIAVILLLAAITMISTVSAGTPNVCRDLPSGSQAVNSEIPVSLQVTVNGATWYMVDEEIPSGLTVTDTGGADTSQPGHLKWVVLQDASNTTITYKVKGSAGAYNFGGEFQIEGMANPAQIDCDTQLTIGEVSPPTGESNICRDLPSGSQAANSEIPVSLQVTVNGATWYMVDEKIPSGLTVTDTGGADTTQPGHLKWVVLQDASNTTITYKVKGSAGVYNFGGEFQIEGMANPAQIDCDTQLTIGEVSPPTGESNICRDLPSGSQVANSEIPVSLQVTVNGATWYMVDEEIPSGLTVTDTGGADTSQPGHLKWVVLQDASNTTITYKVKGSAGAYNFGGEFQIEGMANPAQIDCDTQLTVAEVPEGILLQPGWNFVSVPYELENSSVDYVLADINYSVLAYYNALNKVCDDVLDLEPLKGYWICNPEEGTQVILGELLVPKATPPVPATLTVYEGWNAIGYTDSVDILPAEVALSSIDESYETIKGPFDPVTGSYEQVGWNGQTGIISGKHVGTDVFEMGSYEAFWVFVTQEDMLSAV